MSWVSEFAPVRGYEEAAKAAQRELLRVAAQAVVIYHGGNLSDLTAKDSPTFLTFDPEGAQWFVDERGGAIHALHVPRVKLASLSDLLRAGDATKAKERDIQDNSPYEGTNPLDLVYVPRVRRALERKGFSGVLSWDTLESTDIPAMVVWNTTLRRKT